MHWHMLNLTINLSLTRVFLAMSLLSTYLLLDIITRKKEEKKKTTTKTTKTQNENT